MSLTTRELEAVLAELAPLAGARVEAVRVHAERALTLALHGAKGEVLLLVSAEPDVTRLHAATERPPQPENPHGLQALLRRELEGARLASLSLLPGDRVVELRFERSRGPIRLVAELTGRQGNLFVLDEAGIIRAFAGRNLAARRDLAAGQPWVAPVFPPEADRSGQERQRFAPAPAPAGEPPPAFPLAFPLSLAIEEAYRVREAERRLAEGRKRLREPVRAAVARAGRALAKLAEEAARVPAAEADRQAADLLKQNLRRVSRGARELAVTEWTAEGPREVTLRLDPALTPAQNLEKAYRRYRRIVESAKRVQDREAEVRGRELALKVLLGSIETAPLEQLPRLEREARKLGAGPRPQAVPRKKRDEPLPPYRAFRSLAGVAILVGRNAEDNDRLTLRVARGNDPWLHVRGQTGAHVVVRLEKKTGPDQETLLDAAHLALHFSDGRGAAQADVAWTRAKYVKKAKGAAPGAVTYSQEKVLLLRVQAGRVERLLAEEETEQAP